jgi:hypothetical protein
LVSADAALGYPIPASWQGTVRDAAGSLVAGATVKLRAAQGGLAYSSTTDSLGAFSFSNLSAGTYLVSLQWQGRKAASEGPVEIRDGQQLRAALELSADQRHLILRLTSTGSEVQASGGERLSSREVSELPLNNRDFGQLLLLASGTTTDTNGSANFTQQFAVNGQRGTTAVFAMDGIFASDPEVGGGTFTNFNLEAIQEIRSSSGVMPADIGEGAAKFTDVITKSGTSQIHGSVFEFLRNAAFDARNFFDRRSIANPERLPPFVRNEFGLTNGGPVILPGIYDGRGRTFYFGEYQGFREVLGTTQVFPVPTATERQGFDTTAFPGDTLVVPVNPQIAQVLARYPSPNDPQGPYGARTYATSSKVQTIKDQFSVRIDHRISDRAQLFARFSLNNVAGPTTNPGQTAIDPSFAIRFFDHERNAGLKYTRMISANVLSESTLGFIRATPNYPTLNLTQPGLTFADGLYQAFNSAAGSVLGMFGNVFQARQSFAYIHGTHSFKWGAETRFNRDTVCGADQGANGSYAFGGGPAYAQEEIPSLSGQHNIQPGGLLPDTLTGLLTGTPYSYTISEAPPMFAQGSRIGESAVRREAYNFYFQDAWKISPRLVLNYGMRYEVDSRLHEGHKLTAGTFFVGPDGGPAPSWDPGATIKYLVNPQPPYSKDWGGWGPRMAIEWRASRKTVLRAGGAITTLLLNPYNNDALTVGKTPFVITPLILAMPGAPVPFENAVSHSALPELLTPTGQALFPEGRPTDDVPPNTVFDVERFAQDLAAQTPGHQFHPYPLSGMAQNYHNGYIETYSAGLGHDFGPVKFTAAYAATEGVGLAKFIYVNGYSGASPGFAPYTLFDSTGQVVGGYGLIWVMANPSHSTFNSLQVTAAKTAARWGLGFTASYTFSKALDDSSSPFGPPQDPRNPGAERAPATFDITHALTLSFTQELPLYRVPFFRPLKQKFTSGWQFLNITTLNSGLPFTVNSGIQQTGMGSEGADRPDQVGQPDFSTSRKIRDDYFGRGADNASFFSIPIGIPGGTGPNQGRFGELGRNTFRGPAFHNFDVALTKDTLFGHRGGGEAVRLQFRAEFFNVFNLVNFALPANIVRGSGFGFISSTAGASRQLQFSLKLIY